MKISADPFPALKQNAIDHVNHWFNAAAINALQRDSAHAQKLQWATAGQLDKLADEAKLRGITPDALAATILSKADNSAARELKRQTLLLQIDAAMTPDQLRAVTTQLS